MIITAEISHYPLHDKYENPIKKLIRDFHDYENVEVLTNAMSTYLQGEYDAVMACITECFRDAMNEDFASSTVIKIIPRKLPIAEGYRNYLKE